MKKIILLSLASILVSSASAQIVAKVQITEDIPGICDKKEVYAIFPSLVGQVEAVCPVSNEDILKRLNTEVVFLKDKPKYKDKGMMGMIINCKGEVVQCKMDNKTKNAELDAQIEKVFNSLGTWKPGRVGGKEMDTSRLFSFRIKNGQFTFD